jgi:hypothetical protein
MGEIIAIVLISVCCFFVGSYDEADAIQRRCVAKYAEMPHNKVEGFCKTLLKFEKDPK